MEVPELLVTADASETNGKLNMTKTKEVIAQKVFAARASLDKVDL